jgi:hypothetical protein
MMMKKLQLPMSRKQFRLRKLSKLKQMNLVQLKQLPSQALRQQLLLKKYQRPRRLLLLILLQQIQPLKQKLLNLLQLNKLPHKQK